MQAQAKMAEAAAKAGAMASDMGQRASGQFDRLEGIFEERVAKALHSMGLPNAQDMANLQARVAALIMEGLATKSIAYELQISVHTVRRHTEQIFRKCGVRSRLELTARLWRQMAA